MERPQVDGVADTVDASAGTDREASPLGREREAGPEGIDTQVARAAVQSLLFGQPAAPVKVGRHTIIETVGSGAMGIVYAAYDPKLDRKIAVKVVLDRGYDSEERQSRLVVEAQALARLSHPNIVHVYDTGTHDDNVYIAMEFVDGEPLRTWMQEGPHAWQQVVDVFAQAAEGLSAAHRAGLVHRDFKPDNAFLRPDGRVVVLDFGLAKGPLTSGDDLAAIASRTRDEKGDSATSLTQTGTILGTPAYMAAEQFRGEPADARSDQFSLCAAMFEALYGVRPFAGKTIAELSAAVQAGDVVAVDPPRAVPKWLRDVVRRGLHHDPEQRFDDLDEMFREVQRRRRASRPWIVGALSAGALGLGALLWSRNADDAAPLPCQFDDEPFAGIWDDETRPEIRASILATGAPFAEFAWETVETSLDVHRDRWSDMRTRTCEATHVRGEQSSELLDLRMACLHRRRDEARSVLEVLRTADATALERTQELLAEVGSIDRCADAAYLLARIRPPEDAALAASVEGVRRTLIAADAMVVAGRHDAAYPMAHIAHETAKQLDYAPVRAEAAYTVAAVQDARGEYELAAHGYEDSFWIASDAGHDEQVKRATGELAFLLAASQGRPEAAQSWLRHTEAAMRRLDLPELEFVYLAAQQGSLWLQLGHADRALTSLTAATQQAESLGAPKARLPSFYTNLGATYKRLQKFDEAPQAERRALALAQESFGEVHPETSLCLANLASSLSALEQFAEAQRMLKRAITVSEQLHPQGHLNTAFMRATLARIKHRQGHYEEAARVYAQATEAVHDAVGSQHPILGYIHNNWGETMASLGDLEAAAQHYRAAAKVDDVTLTSEDPERAWALLNLGNVLVAMGRPQAAREPLQRALKLRVDNELDPKMVASTELALGRALWGQGELAQALDLAASARRKLEKADAAPQERSDAAWLAQSPL